MKQRMPTMTILAQRTSSSRQSKYPAARNLSFVLIIWICLLGYDVAATEAAQHTGKSDPGSSAIYRSPVAAAKTPILRTDKVLRATNHERFVEEEARLIAPIYRRSKAPNKSSLAAAQPSVRENTGSEALKTAAARLIARNATAFKTLDESPAAGAVKPTARRKTGSRSVSRVAARRTARSETGSSAEDKLSKAAAQTISESNSNFRHSSHRDSVSGTPTIGELGPSKTAAAWQLPKGPIKKVLVIFEDANVQPYEFWDRSPSCQQCTGLPEKRKIVMDAIARHYAVLIPHPWDIDGMWEPSPGMRKGYLPNSPNILNILFNLAEWKREIGVREDVPTVALGVSSGAVVLSALGLFPGYFESIGLMVSSGLGEAFESCTHDYPPSIFIHMPKDTATAQKVYHDRKFLSANGVPTKEVRWNEHSVTQYWFAELIPGLDQETSSEIHRHLSELQWLDPKTGFLRPDSNFQNEWFEKVRGWNLFPTDLTEEELLMMEDRLFEELNVAYAYHATLARSNNDLFAWFEGGYEGQERNVRSLPNTASVSIPKAGSNAPPPVPLLKPATVSLFKAATYEPATVSLFKEASYKPATVSL